MGDLYLGKIWKRIIASVLDYACVFALAITFFMSLASGYIDIGFHNSMYRQQQFEVQEKSSLFVVEKEGDNYIKVDILDFDEEKNNYKDFLKAINDYYFDYRELENKSNSDLNTRFFAFDEKTLDNPIFEIDSLDTAYTDFKLKDEIIDVTSGETVSSDEEGYIKAIGNYFLDENKGVYNHALTDFTNYGEFPNINSYIAYIEKMEILISMFLASLIVFPLPFLINKNGESLFMHFLKLGFTTRNGYKVKMGHKIIRTFITIVLNTISVYLYFIPLLINFIVMLVTKEKRSLVDIASGEVSVDTIKSTIYLDYEEMEKDSK